jgi:hypothetical protein
LAAKPEAMSRVTALGKSSTRRVSRPRMTSSQNWMDLASTKAASSPSLCRILTKVGTKAMVREPSAKRLLSRLGTRKATKKASASTDAPRA